MKTVQRLSWTICVAAFLLLGSFAHTQSSGGAKSTTSSASGAPSPSTCSGTNSYYVNTANGNLYDCPSGTWTLVSSGATGTVTSIIAGAGLNGGTVTTSGTFSLALPGTLNAITYDNGAGALAELSSPLTNCSWQVIFNVTASASVAPTTACPGVAVTTPATPYTLASTDRATYLRLTGGSTFALTLCQITTTCANNLPFLSANFNSGTLTITANAADKINNSATGGSLTVLANFATWMYQDSSSAPGNWWPIRVPTFEAFGSTCLTGINWSTTAGVGCNSLGVDSGAANAYVVTGTAITTLTATGIIGCFNPTNANTAASTVNFNGLGATNIVKFTNAALIANDMTVGNPACVRYNGSTFTLTNPVQSTGTNKIVLSNGATVANLTNTGTFTTGTAGTIGGIIDLGAGFLTAAMTGQTTATCTNVTNMTWTIAANKNYSLSCRIPRTLAASATLQYCLGGPGTATSYSLDVQGANGSAGAWADLNTLAQTAYGTKTTASAAAANTAVDIVTAQIQNGSTASGTALTLQTAANGTNTITVLANAVCQLVGLN